MITVTRLYIIVIIIRELCSSFVGPTSAYFLHRNINQLKDIFTLFKKYKSFILLTQELL